MYGGDMWAAHLAIARVSKSNHKNGTTNTNKNWEKAGQLQTSLSDSCRDYNHTQLEFSQKEMNSENHRQNNDTWCYFGDSYPNPNHHQPVRGSGDSGDTSYPEIM